jgi:hypothetical protein
MNYIDGLRNEYRRLQVAAELIQAKIKDMEAMPAILSMFTTDTWFCVLQRVDVAELNTCCLVCRDWHKCIVK